MVFWTSDYQAELGHRTEKAILYLGQESFSQGIWTGEAASLLWGFQSPGRKVRIDLFIGHHSYGNRIRQQLRCSKSVLEEKKLSAHEYGKYLLTFFR